MWFFTKLREHVAVHRDQSGVTYFVLVELMKWPLWWKQVVLLFSTYRQFTLFENCQAFTRYLAKFKKLNVIRTVCHACGKGYRVCGRPTRAHRHDRILQCHPLQVIEIAKLFSFLFHHLWPADGGDERNACTVRTAISWNPVFQLLNLLVPTLNKCEMSICCSPGGLIIPQLLGN